MTNGTDLNNIFDNNLDERMAQAIHEDRKRRTQRDRRRRKKAARRKQERRSRNEIQKRQAKTEKIYSVKK